MDLLTKHLNSGPGFTSLPADLSLVLPFLRSPRFSVLHRLRLRAVSDDLLTLLQREVKLQELSLLGTNVALVNPQLLACFVVGIPRVHMVATLTDHRHICATMAAVSEKVNNKLQELNLSGNDLSKVACQHLAGAVTHLRVLHLSTTNLTDDQMEAIFTALNESRRISTLSLRRSQVTHLPPPLFVQGVVRLHQVDLGLTLISPSQLVGLFRALSRTPTNLEKLDLTGVKLSQLEPGLLAEGLDGLAEVTLQNCGLTVEQEKEVLGLAMTKGRLKRVTLDQGHPQNEALFKLVAQKICLIND